MSPRTDTRTHTVALPPYATDLQALENRTTPTPSPVPAPRNLEVGPPGGGLEDRIERAMNRGYHEDRVWVYADSRPAETNWTDGSQTIVSSMSAQYYFRERLEQSISITTVLRAIQQADLEPDTRAAVVEDLLARYEHELTQCLLPPVVLKAVTRAGFDRATRSDRFYAVADRLQRTIVEKNTGAGVQRTRNLSRSWGLEMAVDKEISWRQAATLSLLIEIFLIQSAEARDLEAARDNVSDLAQLPEAVATLHNTGQAEAPQTRHRLIHEGAAIEIQERGRGTRAAELTAARDHLEGTRDEGLLDEPPVFTG